MEDDPVYFVPHAHTRTEYVTRDVHVHEAPTADHARLLRELEKEAEARIISQVRLKDCPIDCVIQVQKNHMTLDPEARAIFSVNGKRYVVEAKSQYGRDKHEWIVALMHGVAEKIATEILAGALRDVPRQFG